jgi:hypothetical protein
MRPPFGQLAVPAPPRPRGFGSPVTQNLPVPRPVQAPEQKQGFMERLLGTDPNLARILGKGATIGARNQALLALGGSLLESSGPSPVPVGTGQALGRGIQAGMGAYQGAMQDSMSQHQAAEFLRAQQAEQERQQRIQGLLSPESVRDMGLTDSQVQLLRGMTPDKALEMLSSKAFAGPAEMDVQVTDVGDQRIWYDKNTGQEIRRESINERYTPPASVQEVGAFLGLPTDSSAWTPQQQQAALALHKELEETRRPQGTTVNVNPDMGRAQQRALETAAAMVAADIPLVQSARTRLERNTRIRDLLEQDPFTGTGANTQATLDVGLQKLGLGDGTRGAATRQLTRELRQGVFDILQNFTGAISEGERAFAESLSGDASITLPEIQELVRISEKANEYVLSEHQRRVDALRRGGDAVWDVFNVSRPPGGGFDPTEAESAYQEWLRSQGGF